MKRGKKMKKTGINKLMGIRPVSTITDDPLSLPPIVKNIGGHLPHPPLDCKRPQFIFTNFGVLWIDLGICVNCPDRCERRAEYIWELKNGKNK